MTARGAGYPDRTGGGALTRAIAEERYDVVALRLLFGLLVTLEETAPAAREALLDELTRGGPR